jgi:predicted negative regulator of RcsB-dependent stress response
MKKILYILLFVFIILGIGVSQYYSFLNKEIDKENFNNFTQQKYENIKNFPENNFYHNIVSLNDNKLSLDSLNEIIENSKSNIIREQALLRKSDLLFNSGKYKESLGTLNIISGDLYKPYVAILKGDVFIKMQKYEFASSEYIKSFHLLQDDLYKIVVLEKIENLKNLVNNIKK